FSFGAFVSLFIVFWFMVMFTVMIVERGTVQWMVQFWYVVSVIVLGVVGFLGLLFFYCVAMISPPSANRVLPLRIYLFCIWAAGGVLYSVGLIVATLAGSLLWVESFLTPSSPAGTPGMELDAALGMIRVFAFISLYAYCFGLSAVLVRIHLLANQIKPAFTWLL